MNIIRAYKFRLYPTNVQSKDMQTHLWLSKNLWNDLLELTKQMYADYERFPSMNALNEFAKTSGLYSQVSQDIFRRLNKAIGNMRARREKGLDAGFPRFKGMDRMKSMTYPQSGFKLLPKKRLRVTPFGDINLRQHRPVEGKIKTLTLKKEADTWYAVLTTEATPPVPKENHGAKVGIDLGLMTFAMLSNGESIRKPKHIQGYETALAFHQRKLSKKKLGGMNRRKARLKISRIHSRVANTRKDWLHKTANNLLSRYSMIAFEDLDVQGIAEKHGKGVSDAGWSMFTDIISYKAEEAGCEVIFVNPKNTTKDCSRCGTCVPKEEHERVHNCPSCGLGIDRDLNAAINVLKRATVGMTGSNACGDVAIATSMNQEADQFIGR